MAIIQQKEHEVISQRQPDSCTHLGNDARDVISHPCVWPSSHLKSPPYDCPTIACCCPLTQTPGPRSLTHYLPYDHS
ncbi:hypothetical protein AALO_G00041770 [Alosa alosa]|uniref:Uncharacterized protein n=1 Tax=Alosa alosa TaxID=278164 RepID=A0AAV6H8J6_9TELE|nr:hypothetical protein AALO_G00041770 [Alosa alosa]